MAVANKPRKPARPAPDPNAPQYRVLDRKHYIQGKRYAPGDVVAYAGVPGKYLEPINEAAKDAVKKARPGKAKAKADEPLAGQGNF